jgi:hypothetical protein
LLIVTEENKVLKNNTFKSDITIFVLTFFSSFAIWPAKVIFRQTKKQSDIIKMDIKKKGV